MLYTLHVFCRSSTSAVDTDAAVPDAFDLETGLGPECAICYNVVDPSLSDHMITPCDHR